MEAPTGGSCTGVPGLDLEGGALLPGVLYSLEEGGAPLETSGGVTRLPPCPWTADSPPGLSLLAKVWPGCLPVPGLQLLH